MTSPRRVAGRDVGPVGLGCMGMSWAYAPQPGQDDPRDVIHTALDLGATFVDTADVYGPFTNEELVGAALAGRRDEAFLASKCGLVAAGGDMTRISPNGSPKHVREAAEASLRRLGVDHVDLYQLHRVDPQVPLAETWGAMAELVERGVARAVGLSEVTAEQAAEAHAVHPVASIQSELSLWTRDPLDAVLPWCEANGAAFVPFSPLGRGYLTGTLTGRTFAADDFRGNLPRFTPEAMTANEALLAVVRAVAERHSATPGQVALAWVLAQGEAVVPIPGTRRVSRLRENVAAADVTLTPGDLAELDGAPLPEQPRYAAAQSYNRR
jgi:aryl-alcohol dehydrogenase-like predicted oxidoreductase